MPHPMLFIIFVPFVQSKQASLTVVLMISNLPVHGQTL